MEYTCPLCGKEMTDYSTPQNPFFVCDECCCDENGIEVIFCEGCGQPYIYDDDPDCDCQWEYCEECGHDYPQGECCNYCEEE